MLSSHICGDKDSDFDTVKTNPAKPKTTRLYLFHPKFPDRIKKSLRRSKTTFGSSNYGIFIESLLKIYFHVVFCSSI